MKNHQSRPNGSTPFSEVNVTNESNTFPEVNVYFSHGRGQERGGKRGRGRKNSWTRENSSYFPSNYANKNATQNHKKGTQNEENQRKKNNGDICFRCGTKGHWSRICRTPKHLVDLYKTSQKQKENQVEANFFEPINPTISDGSQMNFDFDVSDFLEDPSVKIDHLLCDGNDYLV